jgi:hypothetical protein
MQPKLLVFLTFVGALLVGGRAETISLTLENGFCPVHHGTPQAEESAAMEACISSNFCHVASKCIACKLDGEHPCGEAKGGTACSYSYACTISQSGKHPGLKGL